LNKAKSSKVRKLEESLREEREKLNEYLGIILGFLVMVANFGQSETNLLTLFV